MKITRVRFRFLESFLDAGYKTYDPVAAARVRAMPTDIAGYRPKTDSIISMPTRQADGRQRICHAYLVVETDEGIVSTTGPLNDPILQQRLLRTFAPILIGEDPMDTERLWEILYRSNVNGYSGVDMEALSHCDIALWDLKCKKLGLPLHKLLGGPVQTELPAYANAAGLSYDLEDVRIQTQRMVREGYVGAKWYTHRGPKDGRQGIRDLHALFRTIREAAGPDFRMMLDVWSAWDYNYALEAAHALQELDMAWIEEPLMPSMVDSYARLSAHSPVPISLGENVYTRWGFKRLLDCGAAGVYQPDACWLGGISEALKVMSLMSSYDATVSMHNSAAPVGVQMASLYTASLVPVTEFILTINRTSQYFLKHPMLPRNGVYHLLDVPGVGMEIDEEKVDRSWYLEDS